MRGSRGPICPADSQRREAGQLPIQRPIYFEFIINLGTVSSLGLTIPPTLYALATEVIE